MGNKKKLKNIILSHHIQLALAAGFSIILMAYFSKRILNEPISYTLQAIPPFLVLIYEIVLNKKGESKITKPIYWSAAILLTAVLIISGHIII